VTVFLALCLPPESAGAQVLPMVQIAAGAAHACSLDSRGAVWCWGNNRQGQLGDGTRRDRRRPVRVRGLEPASFVAAGGNHTCAIVELLDTAYCWGDNESSEIARPPAGNDLLVPTLIEGLGTARAIAVGHSHICAITLGGQARCWGGGAYGVDGPYPPYLGRIPRVRLTDSITAGMRYGCAVTASERARCWGSNWRFVLGDGLGTGEIDDIRMRGSNVRNLPSPAQIAAGATHTCAVDTRGRARCWGQNDEGQLGDGTTTNRRTAVAVSGLRNARQITVGDSHSCALSIAPLQDAGTVRCWGSNISHALGVYDGDVLEDGRSTVPIPVRDLGRARAIAAGHRFTCALVGGGVRCWGANDVGQLGDGTTTSDHISTVRF